MREARRDEPTEQFGPYVLYECLGRGGMATVHRAKKQGIEGFERPVALKRMLPWLSADGDFVKSFVREARLAAQLRHTNIAQVYDLGKVDGAYYIAMELVAGRDLREILRHAHNISGPLPVSVAINLLFQICDALDYAHTFKDEQGRPLGLVHRDISPANIIVGEDGTAKIVDFGVAKGTTNTLATQSGMLKGKFSYMAPEMLNGQVDARSDLFAVGIVAWEMLTARPCFSGGDDMEVLQRIATWEPPPPSTINPTVPRELDAWLAMALNKEPRRRFQSAAQMRAGLELVARTPAMRAGAPDVAGWIAWALAQTQPVRPELRADRRPSAPITAPPLTAALMAVEPEPEPRAHTLAVEEAAIIDEVRRHATAVGAAPAPGQLRGRPATSPVPVAIEAPPSGAVVAPMSSYGSSAVPTAAAAVARTVLHESGTGPAPAIPIAAAQTFVPIQPAPAPTQLMQPVPQPYLPPTQAMMLPAQPPGAMPVPLTAIAPTISPDAGVVAPQPVHAWQMSPHPAQAPAHAHAPAHRPVALPPPPAPAPRGTRPRTARSTVPPRKSSALGTFVVILLCAAAAVGGFFLVQQLM